MDVPAGRLIRLRQQRPHAIDGLEAVHAPGTYDGREVHDSIGATQEGARGRHGLPPPLDADGHLAVGSSYFTSMTGRVGAKGQVVIPKPLRDRMNLHPGDEVDFVMEDGRIVLTAAGPPAGLGGRFASSGMAARLLEDRRREPR